MALRRLRSRDDINVIGAPLTEICNRTYSDMRQRQLFKNIIYLGVLSALLDMDVAAIEQLIGEPVRGRDARVCAWCPLPPSPSLAEAFAAHCHRLRRDPDSKKRCFAIIQAEDELAS